MVAVQDPDIITAPGEANNEVVITVKIWLDTSGLTANSTATFNLGASNVTLSGTTANSNPLNPNSAVTAGVATIFVANNENTTLSDNGAVANSVTLSSSAVSVGTAINVFDFFVSDGVGGQSTKIDSLTVPVTFSGGAKKSDDQAIFDEIKAIRDGGGFGSIIGRNTFQRKRNDALKLLDETIKIYSS